MAGRLASFLVRSARRWPHMRAATRHWPVWIARQLLMPAVRVPLTITTRAGARVRLSDDPLDDLVLMSVAGHGTRLYFPGDSLRSLRAGPGAILDLGAHHGIYAIEALRRFPHGHVIAVEPDPASCERLAANVALNGLQSRVRIVNAGLADAAGTGRLERDASGSWGTRVSDTRSGRPSGWPAAGRPEVVPLLTLADILAGEAPVLVKCNAEGAEFAFVPQMLALGLRPPSIVLMAHPRFGRAGDLVQALEAVGYVVRDADDPPTGHRLHCMWQGTRA